MKILRAIYRLDYARNYEMINKPGTVGRLIQETKGIDYFDFFGEDRNARRILVRRLVESEGRFRSFSAEPVAIVCEIEAKDGVEIGELDRDPDFTGLCAIASALSKEFGINLFERVGLRLFLFGSHGKSLPRLKTSFQSLADANLVAQVAQTLGPISDLGYSFDGTSESKVGYHFRMGPFLGADEIQKYFSNINNLIKDSINYDTVIDLDLFETKLAYTAASTLKWTRPHLDTASDIAKRVAEMLKREPK